MSDAALFDGDFRDYSNVIISVAVQCITGNPGLFLCVCRPGRFEEHISFG